MSFLPGTGRGVSREGTVPGNCGPQEEAYIIIIIVIDLSRGNYAKRNGLIAR